MSRPRNINGFRKTLTAFRGYIDATPDLRRALRAGFAFLIIGLAVGASMIARGEILIKSGHRQPAMTPPDR